MLQENSDTLTFSEQQADGVLDASSRRQLSLLRDARNSDAVLAQTDTEAVYGRIPLNSSLGQLLWFNGGADDCVEVPRLFKRVFRYLMSLSPPGHLNNVALSSQSIMHYALGSARDTQFSAGVERAISHASNWVCRNHLETNYVVIPLNYSVLKVNVDDDEKNSRLKKLFSSWGGHSVVVAKGTRIKGVNRDAFPWYIFYEAKSLVEIDPQNRCLLDVYPLNSATWDLITGTAVVKSDVVSQLREELESRLRQEYVPRSYLPLKSHIGISVHLLSRKGSSPLRANERGNLECIARTEELKTEAASPATTTSSSDVESESDTSGEEKKASSKSVLADIEIAICAEHHNVTNFWSGSWTSVWKLRSLFSEDDRAVLKEVYVEGKIDVKLHYSEDGCAFSRHSETLQTRLPVVSPDITELSCRIVKYIEDAEAAKHAAVLRLYTSLHTQLLRSARRVFPLGGGRFDWSAVAQPMIQDVASYNLNRISCPNGEVSS